MERFLTELGEALAAFEFRLETPSEKLEGPAPALYARREGKEKFALTSYDEYLFFHDVSAPALDVKTISEIHWAQRRYVNLGYSTPRPWRLKLMPIVATVMLSREPFAEEVVSFVTRKGVNRLIGGDAGALVLVDIVRRDFAMYEMHPRYRGSAPTGALHRTVKNLCRKSFG